MSLITEFVCIGEQLTLTCRTNRTTLKWTVSNPHTRVTEVGEELISSTQVVDALPPVVVSNVGVFQFNRTSSSPLISVLQINNITVQLNETIVNCSDSQDMTFETVTIKVSPG